VQTNLAAARLQASRGLKRASENGGIYHLEIPVYCIQCAEERQ
jgi:hypothetical protein